MEVCMEWPSGTLARIIGPHVWKDLGPLDPDWFTTLTCEAKVAEQDEPSIEEDLCPNQEAALFKSPLGSRGRCSPLSSTPRVFRPNQALSPQSDHSLFAQPETPLNKESDAQRSSSFDLFAHLHSPLGTDADRTRSPPRSKGSYVRELSERLGAQMGGVSWSSSFNTPPAGDSTWNITRRETESTLTLTENTSVLARKLFHCNHNLSEDGPVLHPPVVTHDADITSLNPNCKNLERPLSGTKNASSPNCSSGKGVFRKVKSERIHRRLFAAVTEPVRDGVESPVKQAESEASDPAEHPPLTQWSPLSLSGLPTEFFSPSVCLSAMKRAKVSGKQESVRQPAQTHSSLQPAQTCSSLQPAQTCSCLEPAQTCSSLQPAQTGSSLRPAQTCSSLRPAQTCSSLRPAQTHSSLQPAQTHSSLQPAQTCSCLEPAQTGSSLQPAQTGSSLRPAQTGSSLRPAQTCSSLRPAQTCSSLRPAQTHSSLQPAQTHSSLQPAQTCSCLEPAQTCSCLEPAQTGSSLQPAQTGSSLRPAQTCSSLRPAQTCSSLRPAQTGSGLRPAQTGSSLQPAQTGSSLRPAQTCSSLRPAQTGSGLQPAQTGSGLQPAQTGSGLQPAQTGSSLQPAQTGSSPQIAQPISSPQPAQAISSLQPAQPISIPQPTQTGRSLKPARAISSLQPAQTLSSLQPAQPISSPQSAQTFSSLQLTESIAGPDSALNLCNIHDSGYSTVPVSYSESKPSSDFKVPPADLTKATQLCNNTENELNTTFSLPTKNKGAVPDYEYSLTVSQKAEVKELCDFLEQSSTQFDFTQKTVQHGNQMFKKSETVPSCSSAKTQSSTLNTPENKIKTESEKINGSSSFTQGFKMASGKGISVSDQNLQKSKELFEDLARDGDGVSAFGIACFGKAKSLDKHDTAFQNRGFKRAHGGTSFKPAVKKAKMCEVEKADHSNLPVMDLVQEGNVESLVVTAQTRLRCPSVDSKETSSKLCSEILPESKTPDQLSTSCGQPDLHTRTCKAPLKNEITGFQSNVTVKYVTENDQVGESGVTSVETFQCGFRTGRGAQVHVSKKHVEKAKHLWKDFEVCVKPVGESVPAPCRDWNELSTDRDMVRANITSTTDNQCEAKHGPEANIETTWLGSKREGRESKALPTSSGFVAASCKTLSVSAEALLKAKALLDEVGSSANAKETSQISKKPLLENRNKKHVPVRSLSSHTHLSSRTGCLSTTSAAPENGFTTANGKTVKVSEEALNKAMVLFSGDAEASDKCPNPLFINANSKSKKPTPHRAGSEGPGLRPQTGHKSNMENGSSTARDRVVIAEKDRTGSLLLPKPSLNNLDVTPAANLAKSSAGGFSTASGKKVKVSEEALNKAVFLFSDDAEANGKCPNPLFINANSKRDRNVELEDDQAGSHLLPEPVLDKLDVTLASDFAQSSTGGFTTASGKTVQVSKEALKKAVGLFSETQSGMQNISLVSSKQAKPQNNNSTPHLASLEVPGLSEGDVKTENNTDGLRLLPERSINKSDVGPFANFAKSSGGGFTTASGKKVLVSEEALKKAAGLLSERAEAQNYKPDTVQTDKLRPGFASDEPCLRGRTILNSGSRFGLDQSADGLDIAKNSGFSTASGKKVGVSEEALNNAIGLFNDVDRVDKSNITRHARPNHGDGGPQASSILNPPVKTSKGVFHPRVTKEVAVPSALVNLDGLQLHDCSSTQQQFLAQEALDCTRALLEDEVRAGQSLTVTSKPAVKPAGKRVGQPDESVGRKPSPERSDRALAELRPPPVLSALGGLLKDRRVFQYHVSRQPNAPRPRGCVKEQATVPLSFTSVKREAAEPNRPAFVPPFLNPKTKACKEGARTDHDTPCTFVPPFKKHKSDVHENNSSWGVKGLSDTHTFRPPTPKEPNPKEERGLQMEAPELAEEEESARAGQGLNEGTGEEATHDHVGSMADLARDLQDMRIRKKRRQTIRALPGSLFLSKTSGLKRLSLRAAMNGTPQKYSPKELYEWGVDQQLCDVTSQTAQSFCLDLRRFYQPQCFSESGAVQLADGGWLVPRRDGTVGKEEFYKALCDTPGVDPQLISPLWVYNHYRWIVWKLASLERAFPKSMGSVCLGPEQLLLQLKYRYDVEVDHSQRSALRRIFERDDTAAKTMVLCVCGPFSEAKPALGQGPGQDPGLGPGPAQESPTAVVWLTDGWYSIKCQLDVPLTSMLQRGHITEGVKLMVHGAQLIGSEEACGPLEAPDCLSLKICANSTRRARWDTRLGYYRDPRPFVLPLSSLFSTGGAVGSVDMVILRIYPQQWMERKAEGGLVFRSGRAEEKEARRHLQQKEKHLERLYAKIRAQFDQEERDGVKSKGSRRSVRLEELSRLQEGEELYEAVGEELAEVEPYLSSQQLHALCLYKRDALEQRQKQLQERLRRAVEQEEGSEGSFPRRQVTPVWRLSIADYQDPRGSTVYQLSVWSPSAELQSLLKEGGRYRTYNLTATEPRSGAHRGAHPGAGRATVQLTATRKTRFTSVQASPLWLSAHFRPRDCVTYTDLQNPDFLPVCGEVDLAGAVVSITDQHGPSPAFYLALECLSVVRVRCGLGPSRCEWDEVLQPHALLCITNLQVRSPCGSLPTLHTGDLTELSTQSREAYLQQGLSRLRQAVQDQGDFFTRAEQSVRDLSWSEGQTMKPRTPRSRGVDQRSPQTTPTSRPQTTAASPSSWEKPSPVFKTPGHLSCFPQKKDPRSSKRRRALDHLSRYAPPPPLPPLSPAQHTSPHVNKTFCPPRRSCVPANPAHTKGEAGPVCTSPAPTSPAHTEGEGWVHDDELAMIDTQELRAVDSLMD